MLTCDEPGGLTCPDHWSCEPGSPNLPRQSYYPQGSTVTDPPESYDLILAGCVRKTCADEDGYGCTEFYACDLSASMNSSGCAAIPCMTNGHCSGDGFICTPTSTATRPLGIDAFGCVIRNCEEGVDCSYVSTLPGAGYCNPTATNSNLYGCAIHSCLDGDYCNATEICAPGTPNADVVGCAPSGAGMGGTGGGAGVGGTGGGTDQDFGPGRCVSR